MARAVLGSTEEPVRAHPHHMSVFISKALLWRAGKEPLARKVEVEVFGLDGQIRCCCHFDPAPCGKARHQPTLVEGPQTLARRIRNGASGDDEVRMHMRPSNPGRLVEQHSAPRVPGAFPE